MKRSPLQLALASSVAALFAGALATALPAQALTQFDLRNPPNGASALNYSLDGINLKISNFAPDTLSQGDGDGLCVAGIVASICPNLNSLNLQFDKHVRLVDFTVGYNSALSDTWTLKFSQGPSSSTQTDVNSGLHLFDDQFVAIADLPINMIATEGNNAFALQLSFLSVELASPPPTAAPGPLPLLGVAAAFGYSRKVRRRVASSRP
jgi:hypothetical protein